MISCGNKIKIIELIKGHIVFEKKIANEIIMVLSYLRENVFLLTTYDCEIIQFELIKKSNKFDINVINEIKNFKNIYRYV